MNDFKFFTDVELTNEVPNDTLDFGRVKVGDTKQYTYYLYNSARYPYEDIELVINREEIKVISAPSKLAEKTSAKVVLEWKPLISTVTEVKPTIKINGLRIESL